MVCYHGYRYESIRIKVGGRYKKNDVVFYVIFILKPVERSWCFMYRTCKLRVHTVSVLHGCVCVCVCVLLCADIDECTENTDGCSQVCTNSIGSYECSCRLGYRLDADQHTCNGKYTHAQYTLYLTVISYNSDINECAEGTDDCAQNCHNNVGSYTCSCNTGYRLNADGFGCDGNIDFLMQIVNVILVGWLILALVVC